VNAKRGGRQSAALTQLVLSTYGRQCHLNMPGCTRFATTKDHLVPWSLGGTHQLSNLRPACRHCNTLRGNRVISGYGNRYVVVMGPPAAGKTWYVREHARPADVVLDLDAIVRALMPIQPDSTHVYPEHTRDLGIGARQAALKRATRRIMLNTVWIIKAQPTVAEIGEWRSLRYELVTIDPGRAIVTERAKALRPPEVMRWVDGWYRSPLALPARVVERIEAKPPLSIEAGEGWTPEW
jgi:hypothetical protein